MKEYSLKDLQKDLRTLDRKVKALDRLKSEISESIIAPVYLARQVELFSKYFGLKSKTEVEGYEPLEDDERRER